MSEIVNKMNNILYGGRNSNSSVPVPDSLGEFCISKLRQQANNVLIVDGLTSKETTASEILSESIRVAESLLQYGITVGDVIAICSENSLDYISVAFGAFFVGITVAPICITLTESELSRMFNITQPKILFTMQSIIGKVAAAAKECSTIKDIILFNCDNDPVNAMSFKSFMMNANITSSKTFDCKPEGIENILALIYSSSGTSGLPKGIEITQSTMTNWLSDSDIFTEPMTSYTMGVIPFSSMYGFWAAIKLLLFGRKAVLLPKYEEINYLTAIEKYKITFLLVNPRVMNLFCKNSIVDKYDTASLTHLVCSGGPLTEKTIIATRQRLGVPNILQVYGLSEMGLIANQDEKLHTLGSFGKLVPGVWGKVVDLETGIVLGPNQIGEFCFKKNYLFKRYVNNAEGTNSPIDIDGYFCTGDIGYYNEYEEWFFVDRLKEIIKYGSYHVAPTELETILLAHPNVRDACVVGLPDEAFGQLPLAFVVKHGDVTEEEIVQFVAEQIADAKQLRGGVRFIAEIPRNAFGKHLRRVLRDSLKK